MKNRTIRLGWTLLTELWQNWTRKKGFATPTICWKFSRAFGNHLDPVNDSRDGRLEGKCDSDPCFPDIRRLRKNCTFEGSDTLYKYSIFDLPPSETARRRLNKIILTPVKIKSKLMTEYNEGQAIWRVSKVTRRVLYVIGVVAAFLCFAGSSATFTAIFVVFCSHCSRPNSLLVWLNGLAAVSLAAIGITILYFVIFGCREGDNTENDADVVISEIPAEDVEKSPAPVIPYNHIPHYSPFVQPSSRDLPDYFTTIQNSNGGDLPDYYSILQKGNGAQLFVDAEISGDITPPCYEKALEMTRSGTACVDVRSSNSIWPFVWGKGIIISQNGTIMTLCIMYLDTYQIAAADVKSIMALLSQNSVAFSSGKGERAKRERVWKSAPRERRDAVGERKMTTSLVSRGVIFTRARVSLVLLSLRKNGDYL